LKARGLITSPAFILLKAADHFAQLTTAVNELWQTDFTYLRLIGWGWFYLSTVRGHNGSAHLGTANLIFARHEGTPTTCQQNGCELHGKSDCVVIACLAFSLNLPSSLMDGRARPLLRCQPNFGAQMLETFEA